MIYCLIACLHKTNEITSKHFHNYKKLVSLNAWTGTSTIFNVLYSDTNCVRQGILILHHLLSLYDLKNALKHLT